MADVTDDCVYIGGYRDYTTADREFDRLREQHRAGGLGGFDAALLVRDEDDRIRVARRGLTRRSDGNGTLGLATVLEFAQASPAGGTGDAWANGSTRGSEAARADMRDALGRVGDGQAVLVAVGDPGLMAQLDQVGLMATRFLLTELRSGPEIDGAGLRWVVRAVGPVVRGGPGATLRTVGTDVVGRHTGPATCRTRVRPVRAPLAVGSSSRRSPLAVHPA